MSNTATKLDASAAQTVAGTSICFCSEAFIAKELMLTDKLLSLLRTLACPTEFMHNAVLALHAVPICSLFSLFDIGIDLSGTRRS